jgi:hypothetical protein
MHAATARSKTPGTKRSKTAPNPWQTLPRLADLFEGATPQPLFKGSKVPELEELALTETQLLEQTAALLGVSLAQLVRAGALVYAKREFLNHKKYSTAAAQGDSEGGALLRSGSGVAGVADARIQTAYQTLADAKLPITPAKLATRALTGYPTALRWLKIHHPELLAPKPEEPAAPAAAEQGPQSATHAKTAQKHPQAAPRNRGAAKARKLPKPLRNPKNHPELLGPKPDEAPVAAVQDSKTTTHSKTAHKPSETAPRNHGSAKDQKPAKRLRNPENEPF